MLQFMVVRKKYNNSALLVHIKLSYKITRLTTSLKSISKIRRKDKRKITLVDCQNLISRIYVSLNKIVHNFIANRSKVLQESSCKV